MLSSRCLLIPFALQMAAMAADEFCFHRRRGLPRWERLGHPLDTLTVLACFAWLLLRPPHSSSVAVYAGMCAFSTLFVTKDEWVHSRCCTAGEQWLHALLFILHPLVLIAAGLLWPVVHGDGHGGSWLRYEGSEAAWLSGIFVLTLLFGIYQLLYWNLIWRPGPAGTQTARSTTNSTTS